MITRRSFLKRAALSAAATGLSARIHSQAKGSNGDIAIAVVGFNGRGQSHIKGYLGIKGVRIVALCDVDTEVLDKGAEQLKAKGREVKTYQDIRNLLEDNEIDAISVATPNHWHSLAGIWAIEAGKDLYLEKPVSHNVWEGRQLVKFAAASPQIVQMGVQSRSAYGIRKGIEWANQGPLGRLLYVRGLCYKRRPSIGKVDGPQPVPSTVNYDLWCGPAAKTPLMRKKLHYDWHWVWETGNGDLGNQGIHQMDIARRFTGENTVSPKVLSIGGRLGYIDDGETANSQIIFHDYANAPLIFEVRGLPEHDGAKEMDKYRGAAVGVVAQYERGYIVVPNYNDAIAYDPDGNMIQKFSLPKDQGIAAPKGDDDPRENHFANFISAVRSRNAESLNGKILDGHLSSALCHTGNISHRVGQKKSPDEIREAIKGDKEATDSFERLAKHLAANKVDINIDKLTLGQFLKMDVQTEKFIDNPEADKLLTRQYRAPFVVPEKA